MGALDNFKNSESKVMSFMEHVQEEMLIAAQNDDFLNSTDYKLKKLNQCENEGRCICLDTILRSIYKDAIPLNDDYKTAYTTDIDNHFDTFMKKRCPQGIEFYVKEGIRRNSPFAKKVLEAVDNLVQSVTNPMGMDIENIDQQNLVFKSNDDLTQKIDNIKDNLNTKEISEIVAKQVGDTVKSEILRAQASKKELANIEDELANDIKVRDQESLDNALEYRDMNQPVDYKPSLFEAVMINKTNELQKLYENGDVDKYYTYGALDEYRTEANDDKLHFASLEELALIESVKEYTALSILKALRLESFNKYEVDELAQEYAQA